MTHQQQLYELVISTPFITTADVEPHLSWTAMTGAIASGHQLPPPLLEDVYLERQGCGYFNRCAWIDGLGLATKTVTVFPDNRDRQPPLPTAQGAVLLFDD
ncbi:MAG: hypothetical protein HKN70_06695, partial [Gammaproteobacteria bacterium]|nr:hypothetical protein [Gammaproteobacteria bacterium]